MQPISIGMHLYVVFKNEFHFLTHESKFIISNKYGIILGFDELINVHMKLRMHELDLCTVSSDLVNDLGFYLFIYLFIFSVFETCL